MREVAIHANKLRAIPLFLGGVALIAGGVYLIMSPNYAWPIVAFGWIAVVFFGGCVVVLVRQALSARPQIVLSPLGLTDNTALGAKQPVPWSEIAGTGVVGSGRTAFVCIHLTHPESYRARLGPLKAWLSRTNEKMMGAQIFLQTQLLDMSATELQSLIEEYRTSLWPPRPSGPWPHPADR